MVMIVLGCWFAEPLLIMSHQLNSSVLVQRLSMTALNEHPKILDQDKVLCPKYDFITSWSKYCNFLEYQSIKLGGKTEKK